MLILGSETEERLVAMAEQNNGFNKNLILIGAIILIILAGGASYFYTMSQSSIVPTNSTMTASASAMATSAVVASSENMTASTSANATTLNTATNATTNLSTLIQQNATTQDFHVTLQLGPPAQILSMNQAATATGEVIVNGKMLNSTSMNLTDTYHLEVHVYNITTGKVETNQNVSIQIINQTTNKTVTIPVITMYDMKIGPSDTNFGNNITLQPGSYTILVNVAGETAKFNINVTTQ